MTKPADFFVGVLEFFAILMPGGAATGLLSCSIVPLIAPELKSYHFWLPHSLNEWVLFLFSAYVLGHFVHSIGSHLDPLYDAWRQWTKPLEKDKTFQAARHLRKSQENNFSDGHFSELKWSKVYVRIRLPSAIPPIERLEANSKFFRSFAVLSIASGIYTLTTTHLGFALAALSVGGLSLHRYFDQRWKSSELTYATAVLVSQLKR